MGEEEANMEVNAVPKPSYKRYKPKRGYRSNFNAKTRERIKKRDGGLCRVCGSPGNHIHHVRPRARQGRGVESNGMLTCFKCHEGIHRDSRKLKYWQRVFEEIYGEHYYLDQYDLKG